MGPLRRGGHGSAEKEEGSLRERQAKPPHQTRQALRLGARKDRRRDRRLQRLVKEDPEDEEAVSALDQLLRAEDRRDDLRWLFELRATRGPKDARAAVLSEWASLEQDVFGEPERATQLYRRVLEVDPAHEMSMRTLPRLLLAQGKAADAAEVLEAHRDQTEGEPRAALELELANIYLDSLARPTEALESAGRALAILPHDPRAVTILDRLLAMPVARARAAALLEVEYEATGDPRRQAQALGVLLQTTSDKPTRLELYTKLADIEETRLSAAGRAFEVVLRGLGEFPHEIPLWNRANQLAARSARPTDLAEAYRSTLLSNSDLPADIELELCDRAATLHDEKLGDPEAATPYLERILAKNPGDGKAFGRLKQILTSAEKWGELESLYDKAITGTTDAERRADLLNEVALVCEEITNEPIKAISYYEAILDLEPGHDNAMRALEQLYAREGHYAKLAALLERRLENSTQRRHDRPQGAPRSDRSRSPSRPRAGTQSPRRGAPARREQFRRARLGRAHPGHW